MIMEKSILVAASADRVYAFVDRMEENYLRFHPDHIAFRWLQPGRLAEGNRFYFEERVNGQHIRRTVRLTRVEPGRLIRFVPENPLVRFFLPRIEFEMEPVGEGARFTQRLRIRIGPIGRRLNRAGFRAVERHMEEEAVNLKAIVEGGSRRV